MKNFALAAAFILELVAFIGFASSSFLLPLDMPLQIIMFVILLSALVVFWGRFMAPRAPKKLKPVLYYLAKASIYIVAAYTLFQITENVFGVLFIATVVIDEAILFKHNEGRRAEVKNSSDITS
jgi:Protein of unknown function (DUF2568)